MPVKNCHLLIIFLSWHIDQWNAPPIRRLPLPHLNEGEYYKGHD